MLHAIGYGILGGIVAVNWVLLCGKDTKKALVGIFVCFLAVFLINL